MVYSKQSYVYRASGGHFDRCDELETHSAQQIRNFRIYNSHYLAVANHPAHTGFLLLVSINNYSFIHLCFQF